MSVRTSVPSPRAPMVKIRAVVKKEELKDCVIIILIGPTGGGKSNFIEKLVCQAPGGADITGIADHKLTPGTADVVTYRMDHQFLDLWTDKPIIFVDTPGLCDKDKSDSQTRAQIQKWMKKNAVKTVDRLLYVDRISDNRAPRSKSNTIEVLEALCGKDAAGKTVVMTAMWDLMWNERLKTLANRRYDLLKNGYWKDYLEKGCQIGTFDNTFEAGWKILKMFGPPHHASALDITLQVIEAALGNPLAMSTNPHLAALLLKGKARIIEDMKMPYDETLEAKRPTHDGWLSKLKEITGAKSTEPQGLASYRTSSSQNGHHEGVITPVISTAILTECHDSPISSPLRQKAMTLQRQVLDERHWRSIFYDAGNKLSLITMDKIQPEDIVVLLLGSTGSGRSSFISMFDNQKTEWVRDMMGHDMESKTTEVKAIRVPIPGELFNLVLLDTPGFNNATQKDIVTLTIIGDALQDRPGRCVRVNSVIYFEAIDAPNMKLQKKYLRCALDICGQSNYDRIAFMTTHWDSMDAGESNREAAIREKEFITEHWGDVLSHHNLDNDKEQNLTRVGRFSDLFGGGRDAVMNLTWALVKESHVRMALRLQVELSQGLEMAETSAGKTILAA